MRNNEIALLSVVVILLLAGTAAASIYFTKENAPETTKVVIQTPAKHYHRPQAQAAQVPVQQQAIPACNDGNIAGKAVGGVGGGVAGSMAGKGNGKTAATIAGTLGGAYLGGQVIPLNGVTCR